MTGHPLLRRAVVALLAVTTVGCADAPLAPAPADRPARAAIGATTTCSDAALGPVVVTRTTGAPTTYATTFAATPGSFYRLEARELAVGGASAEVRLNDAVVLARPDLAGRSGGSIVRPVVLAASNRLDVQLAGRPGAQLEIRIVDTRAPAWIEIAPATRVIVTGGTRAYTAAVLDAAGQPIARCVTWSTANPAIATVDAEGRLHGVSAGVTDLIARVDGMATGMLITVVERAGPTQTAGLHGYCVVDRMHPTVLRACFDAILRATPVAGGRTLIELSLRNRQGSLGAEALPGSSIHSLYILGRSGTGPVPIREAGWSVSPAGAVAVVGSPMALVTTVGISYAPHPGGPHYEGTAIHPLAVLGCATVGSLTPDAYWQTCGNAAGTIDVVFFTAGTWDPSALFLLVSFYAQPVGTPQPACSTMSVPSDVCQQRLPALPQ